MFTVMTVGRHVCVVSQSPTLGYVMISGLSAFELFSHDSDLLIARTCSALELLEHICHDLECVLLQVLCSVATKSPPCLQQQQARIRSRQA